jgi:hypothetical protein
LSKLSSDFASVSAVMLGARELADRPSCFTPSVAARWYGSVAMPTEGLSSLVGMSGGPIFAMKWVDGTLRYWLHAIQTHQAHDFPRPPFIAANLARPFLGLLARAADKVDGLEHVP